MGCLGQGRPMGRPMWALWPYRGIVTYMPSRAAYGLEVGLALLGAADTAAGLGEFSTVPVLVALRGTISRP